MLNFDGQATIGTWSIVAQAAPDLFFMMSGFILMNSIERPLGGWRGLRDYLVRRFFRIYPAYWVIGISVYLLWLWNPSWWSPYFPRNSHSLVSATISSFFLIPQNHLPLLVVAWTIIYEIYLYLVVAFVFLFDVRGRLIVAGFWFLAIALVNIYPAHHRDAVWNVITSPFSLEFITGMFLAAAYRMELPQLRSSIAMAACALAFLLIVWATMSFTEMTYFYDHPRWRVFCFGPPVALIIAMSLWMEKQGNWATLGKLSFIGDRSYSLYLVHVPILQLVFRSVLWIHPHPSPLIITLATLLGLAITVPATELLYQTVELRYIRFGSSRRRDPISEITQLSSEAAGK